MRDAIADANGARRGTGEEWAIARLGKFAGWYPVFGQVGGALALTLRRTSTLPTFIMFASVVASSSPLRRREFATVPTIVEQLQADAINPDVPVSSLLRKVKLVAVKLGLPEVEEWVSSELNGYTGEVPDYRRMSSRPHVLNPVRSWIPMQGPPELIEMVSDAHVAQSIASIESLLQGKDSTFYLHFPAEVTAHLNTLMNYPWPAMGHGIARNQLAAMLDSVRTKILDWALALEKQGIMGSEIGFDASEKKLALDKTVNIHIAHIANFNGSVATNVSGKNSRANIGSKDRSNNKA